MMVWISRFLLVLTVVLLAASASALGPPVAAQEATPAPGLGEPDPAECTIEPRSAEFFAQYSGTPTAEQLAAMTAEATPPPDFMMPEGAPVDEETEAEVLATVRHLGACLNAGDFFGRYAAFFSDDFLERQFEQYGPIPEEELAMMATPMPLPADNRVSLLAVVDIRELPDGRIAALIDVQDPFMAPPGPARIYWVFVEEDGRLLIDDEIMLGPIEAEQIGTPAA